MARSPDIKMSEAWPRVWTPFFLFFAVDTRSLWCSHLRPLDTRADPASSPSVPEHPHEFRVHLGGPASTSAGHLIDGEIGGDHVSHEHSSSKNKFTAQYKQAALEFPIRFQLRLHLKNPPVV